MPPKKQEKKSFHPARHFRLSEKNMALLRAVKKGTWNYTIGQLLKRRK